MGPELEKQKQMLENDFSFVSANFGALSATIKQLETVHSTHCGTLLAEAIDMVKSFQDKIQVIY